MTGSYLDQAVAQARAWDQARPRTQQRHLGWSNMADCRAWMGYRLRGDWETDQPDTWRPIAGTALHDHWWESVRAAALLEAGISFSHKLKVTYRGIPGTADEVLWPAEPGGPWSVTDWKFPRLASIRLWNDDEFLDEMFIQPHGYAAGVLAAGGKDLDPAQCTVRLLGAPVDGTFDEWRMDERPFDQEVADAAVDGYETVVSAVAAGEQLPRDKPFWFCEQWCEFVSACRGYNRDYRRGEPEEITDPELKAAVNAYGLAGELIHANEKLQKELRPLVEGLRGYTPEGWQVSISPPRASKVPVDEKKAEELLSQYGQMLPLKKVPPGKPVVTVGRRKVRPPRKERS